MRGKQSLYICAIALGVVAPVVCGQADTKYSIFYSFTGGSDGANPLGNLLKIGPEFYGTTYFGGAYGHGTVFKIARDGSQSVLYSFTGGKDGSQPYATLVADKAGNFYGTTYIGGQYGYGAVFKVAGDGTETVLHSFSGGVDGGNPEFGLIIDRKGNLYGQSGANIFEIKRNGTEKVLHTFGPSENPNGDLLQDSAGALYGTTHNGGAYSAGSVWKIAADGTETTLYDFKGASDAGYPFGGLIADSAGNLYGTSWGGGITGGDCGTYGCGTVWQLTPGGVETVLHSFAGGSDGAHPQYGRLVRDDSGNLYGMTIQGGPGNYGTIFKVAADGSESLLHTFSTSGDGYWPNASLIADKKGHLYGMAQFGGSSNAGAVFRLKE